MSCHHNDVHDMNECKECAYLQKDARRSEIMKRVRRRPNSPVPSDEETELEEDAELGDEIENPASESLNDFLINIHQKMLLLRGS